jgi:chaperonin cofactor prefoldin
MSIKVIAPLSPAGEFPVADAQNISFGSGDGTSEPKTVAEVITELQQIVGGTGASGASTSVVSKLATIEERLGYLLDRLGESSQEPEVESLYTQVKAIKSALATLSYNLNAEAVDGITSDIQNIYNVLTDDTSGWNNLRSQIAQLSEDIKAIDENLDTTHSNWLKTTSEVHTELQKTATGIKNVADGLAENFSALDTYLRNGVDSWPRDVAEEAGEAIAKEFKAFKTNLSEQLSGQTDALEGTIKSQVDTLAGSIVSNVKEPLDAKIDTVNTNVLDGTGELKTKFDNFNESWSEQFLALRTDLMSNVGNQVGQQVAAKTQEQISSTLDTFKTSWDASLSSQASTITKKIDSTKSALDATIQDSVNAGFVPVKEQISGIHDDINKSMSAVTTSMEQTIENAANSMTNNIDSAVEDLEGVTAGLAKTVDSLAENFNTQIGECAEGLVSATENVNGAAESLINNFSELAASISSLRSHINTISPPTLTASYNGESVYSISSTPSLTITAKVNRPLEIPLALQVLASGTGALQQEGRQYQTTWAPVYTEGASLPYRQYAKVQIVHEDDPTQIFAEESLSCVFGANIYWWTGTDSFTKEKSMLTAGHPGNISFTCENAHCYYAYPTSYGTPTFTVGGSSGGFTLLRSEIVDSISYNIYRSNQALNSVTINIK